MTPLRAELIRKQLSFVYSHLRVFLNLFFNQKQKNVSKVTTFIPAVVEIKLKL